VLFEEWLGFRITVWPPLEAPDDDDVAIVDPDPATAPSRRRSKTAAQSSRLFSV
jgi:hypothetical protein